jgi:hypothetical protein
LGIFLISVTLGLRGGGGEVTRESIASCLRDADAEVSTNVEDLTSIAVPGSGGEGLVATIGENTAAIAVMRSADDAQGLVASTARFYDALGLLPTDLLRQYGKVAVAGGETPTEDETKTLEELRLVGSPRASTSQEAGARLRSPGGVTGPGDGRISKADRLLSPRSPSTPPGPTYAAAAARPRPAPFARPKSAAVSWGVIVAPSLPVIRRAGARKGAAVTNQARRGSRGYVRSWSRV